MEVESVDIGTIILEWHEWVKWEDLTKDGRVRGNPRVPNHIPGVYQVRLRDALDRLYIGKASDLRHRIKQGLINQKVNHSAGKSIKKHQNLEQVEVRWAQTNRPAAVEEYLHQEHKSHFGRLPKYYNHEGRD